MTPAELFNHARTRELVPSEIKVCQREIERLYGPTAYPRIELRSDGSAAIYLSTYHPLWASYRAKSIEEVLIAAYEDLLKQIADDLADGVGQGRAA